MRLHTCLFSKIDGGALSQCKHFSIGSQLNGVIIKGDRHTLEILVTSLSAYSPPQARALYAIQGKVHHLILDLV